MHSKSVEGAIVVKLRKNPNPKDNWESYRVVSIKEDTKDRFGSKKDGPLIQKMRKIYAKSIKKDDSAPRIFIRLIGTGELAPTKSSAYIKSKVSLGCNKKFNHWIKLT